MNRLIRVTVPNLKKEFYLIDEIQLKLLTPERKEIDE